MKYQQDKIQSLVWNGHLKMMAVAVPICLDVDEDRGTCSPCRDIVFLQDLYAHYEDMSERSHSHLDPAHRKRKANMA